MRRAFPCFPFLAFLALCTALTVSPAAAADCVPAGCSGEVCVSADKAADIVTPCIFKPEFQCYREFGECGEQPNGECGWLKNDAFAACIEETAERPDPLPAEPVDEKPCVATGCFDAICAEDGTVINNIVSCEEQGDSVQNACIRRFGACGRDEAGVCNWGNEAEIDECGRTYATVEEVEALGRGEVDEEDNFPECALVCGACYDGEEAARIRVACTISVEENTCYDKYASCEKNSAGKCDIINAPELEDCVNAATPGGGERPTRPPEPLPVVSEGEPPGDPEECVIAGCSGQLCIAAGDVETAGFDDCAFLPEYACYKAFSSCGLGEDGACGWKDTEQLGLCLEDPRRAEITRELTGSPGVTEKDAADKKGCKCKRKEREANGG